MLKSKGELEQSVLPALSEVQMRNLQWTRHKESKNPQKHPEEMHCPQTSARLKMLRPAKTAPIKKELFCSPNLSSL